MILLHPFQKGFCFSFQIVEALKSYLNITADPTTFVQVCDRWCFFPVHNLIVNGDMFASCSHGILTCKACLASYYWLEQNAYTQNGYMMHSCTELTLIDAEILSIRSFKEIWVIGQSPQWIGLMLRCLLSGTHSIICPFEYLHFVLGYMKEVKQIMIVIIWVRI